MSKVSNDPHKEKDESKFIVAPKRHRVRNGGMPVRVKGGGKTVARKKHHKKAIGK